MCNVQLLIETESERLIFLCAKPAACSACIQLHCIVQLLLFLYLNPAHTAGPDTQTPFITAATTLGYRWPY